MNKIGFIFIGLAILTVVILVLILAWRMLVLAGRASRQVIRMGRKAARHLGEELDSHLPRPRISFPSLGRSAVIELARPGLTADRIRVIVELAEDSAGALKIYRESFATAIGKLLGKEDLKIGDPVFDEFFVVQANPPSLAERLFSPERRTRVLPLILSMKDHSGVRFDLSRRRLTISIDGYPRELEALNRLAKLTQQFHGLVLELSQEEVKSIWVTEESRDAVGQCQVCGTPMTSNIVWCRRCDTPHHQECWEYLEMCSTYGCREIRFVHRPAGNQK